MADDCGCGMGDGCQWDGPPLEVEYDIVPPAQERRNLRTVQARVVRRAASPSETDHREGSDDG